MGRIICNFTTWKQRDWCVPIMLEYFQKQTKKPDMVICWLSSAEYGNCVPNNVQKCINRGWITKVEFVHGNTYGHKRYEAFKAYNNDINILMDDDIYYPLDYVESLYNASITHPKNVICYYTRKDNYDVFKRAISSYDKEASYKNRLFSGLSCFPPNTFPTASFNYSYFRDRFCQRCDDSWVNAWLLKSGCKIYGLNDWLGTKASPLNVIKDSQENGIYKQHNSVSVNGITNMCRNLANAIKIAEIDSLAKKLWPTFNFDEASTVPLKTIIPYSPKTYKQGISICITAYNASKYIEEALDSVYGQTYFRNHNNYEVIVGVDGCKQTLDKVKLIAHKYPGLKVYFLDRNSGTYVTSNTVIRLAQFDHILRFDSDDIMHNNMVERLMNGGQNYDVYRFRMKNFGKNNAIGLSWGVCMFNHNFFDAVGGFRDWICSGDAEFFSRTDRFSIHSSTDEVLFDRRVHDESLTNSPETYNSANNRGKIRSFYYDFINSHYYKTIDDAKIKYIVSNCRLISFDEHLVVSLTSWLKRIGNIPAVLDSIFAQTLQPHEIIINLSEAEFKGRNIPEAVQSYINKHKDKVHIQWIKGANIKQWKKILPTFITHPNDAIVCIDDDATYPKDMLEVLWSEHKKHPNNPIGGASYRIYGGCQHCGTCTLDKLCYYGDIFSMLTPEVMNMVSSDTFFSYMAQKVGHPVLSCGREFINERKVFNEVEPVSKTGVNDIQIMRSYLEKKYGKL